MDGRQIRRLDEEVVNRIAAGEVVQRPSAAIKELIENALDAGSTSVKILAKDGGLKLLQISDNGHGIRKEDLPIVCERFTTSKISKFEDLEKVTTFGFRGEALASVTHVAHVTITTKTKSEPCAWKAAFLNGKLVPAGPGQGPEPKPCAGNDGTTITVEDMFFTMPMRRAALKNTSEEYQRILDVVNRYAIHNAGISFSCKKHPSPSTDLSTLAGSSTWDVIKQVYGSTVANEMIPLELENEHVVAKGYISHPNYNARKFTFLLFVNNRLVESLPLKRAIEAAYYSLLPKNGHPFAYVALQLRPEEVDVNMHPTKQEVGLLNEESIIAALSDQVVKILANVNESRNFSVQVTQPKTISNTVPREQANLGSSSQKGKSKPRCAFYLTTQVLLSQQKMVRYNSKVQSILAFAHDPEQESIRKRRRRDEDQEVTVEDEEARPARKSTRVIKEIVPSDCRLTSILDLRDEVKSDQHKGLTSVLSGHTFVGVVDADKGLSLIQNDTRLYLCNHHRLSEGFFYQLALTQFGNYSRIRLEPAPPLAELIEIALDGQDETQLPVPRAEIQTKVMEKLTSNREMLHDYFSMTIVDDDKVTTLPALHPDHLPSLDGLPLFLLRLAAEVDWKVEQDCFRGILHELAYFYTLEAPAEEEGHEADAMAKYKWKIEHRLFPALRRNYLPSRSLLDKDVVQIANLPDLYRVFERC